jgi:hypothetical protein
VIKLPMDGSLILDEDPIRLVVVLFKLGVLGVRTDKSQFQLQ